MEKDYIKYIIDDIIYLIGHGDSALHTIDGQKMEDIAEKLYNAGYTGKQILYITSCYAKDASNGESMYDSLCKSLEDRSVSSQNIKSDFDGLSIIISNANTVEGHTVEGHNVKPYKICEKCGDYKQNNFINSHPYTRKGIYMTVREFIEVNDFKIKLLNILED